MKPYLTAASCIDWSQPMLSIFATRPEARRWAKGINVGRDKHHRVGVPQRPLKINTQKRLAGGLWKWVLNHAEPFIVNLQNSKWGPGDFPVSKPLPTITAHPKGGAFAGADVELEPAKEVRFCPHCGFEHVPGKKTWWKKGACRACGKEAYSVALFTNIMNHGGAEDRSSDLRDPINTLTASRDARGIVGVELKEFIGGGDGLSDGGRPDQTHVLQIADVGQTMGDATRSRVDAQGIGCRGVDGGRQDLHLHGSTADSVAPFTIPRHGEREGQAPRSGSVEKPLPTVTGTANGAQLAAVSIAKHYGGPNGHITYGQDAREPVDTITSKCQQGVMAVALNKHYSGEPHTRSSSINEPIDTITAADHHSLLAVHLTNYHGAKGDEVRAQDPAAPIPTLDTQNRFGLVAAHLVKFRGDSAGNAISDPMPTVTSGAGAARDAGAAHALGLAACYLSHQYTSNSCGGQGDARKPAKTITSGGQHASVCVVYLSPYYGSDSAQGGHTPADPLPTAVGKARFGLAAVETNRHWVLTPASLRRAQRVARWALRMLGKKVRKFLLTVTDAAGKTFELLTTTVAGAVHLVTDILMRMLRPRELARAQGFDDSYVIDRTADGKRVSKADQVKLIGNSVCPAVARAIVKANVIDLGVLDEVPARRKAVAS